MKLILIDSQKEFFIKKFSNNVIVLFKKYDDTIRNHNECAARICAFLRNKDIAEISINDIVNSIDIQSDCRIILEKTLYVYFPGKGSIIAQNINEYNIKGKIEITYDSRCLIKIVHRSVFCKILYIVAWVILVGSLCIILRPYMEKCFVGLFDTKKDDNSEQEFDRHHINDNIKITGVKGSSDVQNEIDAVNIKDMTQNAIPGNNTHYERDLKLDSVNNDTGSIHIEELRETIKNKAIDKDSPIEMSRVAAKKKDANDNYLKFIELADQEYIQFGLSHNPQNALKAIEYYKKALSFDAEVCSDKDIERIQKCISVLYELIY